MGSPRSQVVTGSRGHAVCFPSTWSRSAECLTDTSFCPSGRYCVNRRSLGICFSESEGWWYKVVAHQAPGCIVFPRIPGQALPPSVRDLPELSPVQCPFPPPVKALSRPSASSLPSSLPKEQEKSEKVSKRVSAVEEVRSHVKVLQEMLSRYRRPGQAPPDQEALQVLFSNRKEIKEGTVQE